MNKLWSSLLIASAALLTSLSAEASVLVSAGTQGIGLAWEQPISSYFSTTIQANYYKFNKSDIEVNNGTYDGQLKLNNYGVLLNWKPFAGAFHIAGGTYYNKNKISAIVDPANSSPDAISAGSAYMTFRNLAPYAGLGWTWGSSFLFGLDLGVMFQGTPQIQYTTDCTTTLCTPAAVIQQQDIRDKVSKYDKYPVLRISVGF